MLRLTHGDEELLVQGRGQAGLRAGSTGDAFRAKKSVLPEDAKVTSKVWVVRRGLKMVFTLVAASECRKPTADYRPQVKPSANMALAHAIVTGGLIDENYMRARRDLGDFGLWARFLAEERTCRRRPKIS